MVAHESRWVDEPDQPGYWIADIPGFGDSPILKLEDDGVGNLIFWIAKSIYHGDTEMGGSVLIRSEDPKVCGWWWKELVVPDFCPEFDTKDDPE